MSGSEPTGHGPVLPVFTVHTETQGDATVVRCRGRLIAGTTSILQTPVKRLITEHKRVVLDLTDVTQMDSMGMGAVIALYVSGKRAGCKVELVNLSQRVRELFSMTNVLSLFEVAGDQSSRMP